MMRFATTTRSAPDSSMARTQKLAAMALLLSAPLTSTPPDMTDSGSSVKSGNYWASSTLSGPLVGGSPSRALPTERRISDLKERTDLTWDQVARLFAVSKRAVLHWRAGGNMSAGHEELLARLQAIVDRAPSDATLKDWLMTIDPATGRAPYQDMLQAGTAPATSWAARQPDPGA